MGFIEYLKGPDGPLIALMAIPPHLSHREEPGAALPGDGWKVPHDPSCLPQLFPPLKAPSAEEPTRSQAPTQPFSLATPWDVRSSGATRVGKMAHDNLATFHPIAKIKKKK